MNGDWFVRGHVSLGDLEDVGIKLPVDSDAYTTVGGYVFGELGRLPKRGDQITANGYQIRVESVRENRVEAVRIHPTGNSTPNRLGEQPEEIRPHRPLPWAPAVRPLHREPARDAQGPDPHPGRDRVRLEGERSRPYEVARWDDLPRQLPWPRSATAPGRSEAGCDLGPGGAPQGAVLRARKTCKRPRARSAPARLPASHGDLGIRQENQDAHGKGGPYSGLTDSRRQPPLVVVEAASGLPAQAPVAHQLLDPAGWAVRWVGGSA